MSEGGPPRGSAGTRARAVQRVLWLVLAANWAVAAVKLAWGLIIHSTAMTADGVHSLLDGASNVVGLVAMRVAARPADADHPYGHQKFEALAALGIGVMVGVGVLELGRMAVDSIARGIHPQVGPGALATMAATLVANVLVTTYERRKGQALGSTLLLADAQHTLSDVGVTIFVMVALGLSWAGLERVDGVVALLVLGFVAATGWSIIKRAAGILTDTARLDPAVVGGAVRDIPEVRGVKDVRSRGMEGAVYVDLKIDVAPALPVATAHQVSDAVEAAIKRHFPEVVDVIVHVEPEEPLVSGPPR